MNVQQHLTDDELIARLYGLDAGRHVHLESCDQCMSRWEAMQERRASVIAPAAVSSTVLGAQRREVLAQLGAPSRSWRRIWVPALAAAMLIAAGLAFYHPAQQEAVQSEAVAVDTVDPAWYDDGYSAQPMEPRAASPLRALFEEEVPTE